MIDIINIVDEDDCKLGIAITIINQDIVEVKNISYYDYYHTKLNEIYDYCEIKNFIIAIDGDIAILNFYISI